MKLTRRRFAHLLASTAALLFVPLGKSRADVLKVGDFVELPGLPPSLITKEATGNSIIPPDEIVREALRILHEKMTFSGNAPSWNVSSAMKARLPD